MGPFILWLLFMEPFILWLLLLRPFPLGLWFRFWVWLVLP